MQCSQLDTKNSLKYLSKKTSILNFHNAAFKSHFIGGRDTSRIRLPNLLGAFHLGWSNRPAGFEKGAS